MIRNTLVGCAVLLATACNNEKKLADTGMNQPQELNTLTKQEKKDGWKLLFDGSSTKGWHVYGNKPVSKAWKIDDNSISLDSKSKTTKEDGGDLVSDEEFDNFHLKYDWKVESGGNSGVLFYVKEDAAKYEWPYYTGPEMQVLDNAKHPDAKIIKHRAGDLYDLISSSKETVKPAMEWNHAEIRSLNGKLDFFLNGENIVSTVMWDDNWKQMVAGSKFKKLSDFGTFKKGKLSLQDHGNNVWFRNIKIKKL
jgi:hypothetical protein